MYSRENCVLKQNCFLTLKVYCKCGARLAISWKNELRTFETRKLEPQMGASAWEPIFGQFIQQTI